MDILISVLVPLNVKSRIVVIQLMSGEHVSQFRSRVVCQKIGKNRLYFEKPRHNQDPDLKQTPPLCLAVFPYPVPPIEENVLDEGKLLKPWETKKVSTYLNSRDSITAVACCVHGLTEMWYPL